MFFCFACAQKKLSDRSHKLRIELNSTNLHFHLKKRENKEIKQIESWEKWRIASEKSSFDEGIKNEKFITLT